MKIILSRKGTDSGCRNLPIPSPILPDGTLLSLPIPHDKATVRYAEVVPAGHNLGRLVADLTEKPAKADDLAHLDPDLWPDARPRQPGWRPLFGQTDGAQRHLDDHGVGCGDLFLFFGWFRQVELHNGRYRFKPSAPNLHVLFGWLEVGQVIRRHAGDTSVPAWAADHPHFAFDVGSRNTIYVAPRTTISDDTFGGGAFRRFDPGLVLTAPGQSCRSTWRLPAWFMERGQPALSCHQNPARWSCDSDGVQLRSAARGQEFILDVDRHPEAQAWARDLVRAHARAA
jgi:hypothetical protein